MYCIDVTHHKIISGGDTGLLIVSSIDGHMIHALETYYHMCSVKFFPCGQLAASYSGDGFVNIWDIIKGELEYSVQYGSGNYYSRMISISKNGLYFASCSDESIIKLSPAGIAGKSALIEGELTHLTTHASLFNWTTKSIIYEDITYVSVKSLVDLERLAAETGLILLAGDEETIGLKEYDELDEILDAVEEM